MAHYLAVSLHFYHRFIKVNTSTLSLLVFVFVFIVCVFLVVAFFTGYNLIWLLLQDIFEVLIQIIKSGDLKRRGIFVQEDNFKTESKGRSL